MTVFQARFDGPPDLGKMPCAPHAIGHGLGVCLGLFEPLCFEGLKGGFGLVIKKIGGLFGQLRGLLEHDALVLALLPHGKGQFFDNLKLFRRFRLAGLDQFLLKRRQLMFTPARHMAQA